MRYDDSWNAVIHPGGAPPFFEGADSLPLIPLPTENTYDANLAWLLSEVSRLTYFLKDDPNRDSAPFLKKVSLREVAAIDIHPFFVLLLSTAEDVDPSFSVIAFRGTINLENWVTNLKASIANLDAAATVHRGFLAAFEAIQPALATHIHSLQTPLYFTGHSLGGALATLAAHAFPGNKLYTFGSPRVGNEAFVRQLESHTAPIRIVNHCDIVTTLPWEEGIYSFRHTGTCHYFNHEGKHLINPSESTLALDKLKRDISWKEAFDLKQLKTPLKTISDHCPINYTYTLEQELDFTAKEK